MSKKQKVLLTFFIVIQLINICVITINIFRKNYSSILINVMSMVISCVVLPGIFGDD